MYTHALYWVHALIEHRHLLGLGRRTCVADGGGIIGERTRGRPGERDPRSKRSVGIEMTGCLWPCVGAAVAGHGAGHRKAGLFRSKPRTPAEVVQHARDLVTYILDNKDGCGAGKRDAKHEHRVTRFLFCQIKIPAACMLIDFVYVHVYTLLFITFCFLISCNCIYDC